MGGLLGEGRARLLRLTGCVLGMIWDDGRVFGSDGRWVGWVLSLDSLWRGGKMYVHAFELYIPARVSGYSYLDRVGFF